MKLKEYLLQEQSTQELSTGYQMLDRILNDLESAMEDIRDLRKSTKAVAGRELKQLETTLKSSHKVGESALKQIGSYVTKLKGK